MQQKIKDDMPMYLAIAFLSGVIFLVDFVTRLGYAEWVFYILPVVLSKFQRRPYVPFLVATVETALIVTGYFLSPDGIDAHVAGVNRGSACWPSMRSPFSRIACSLRAWKISRPSWNGPTATNPEFLANMSHELRTPLNSSLILS